LPGTAPNKAVKKANRGPGRPFVKGDPRINRTIPGSGRPPGSFKDFIAEIRASPEPRAALEVAASDPYCRNFGNAWKVLVDYDEDKPAEKKELSGKVEMVVVVERESRRITR